MNHVTTLAAKEAEFIVKALLAFLWSELAICFKPICHIHFPVPLDLDLLLSLSVELDSEVDRVGLSFWLEFRFGLLVLSDFCLGFGIADVSWESLDQHSQ